MVFPAKVDLWFLALFYGLGVLMILAAPMVRHKPRGGASAALLFVIGALFVGIGWCTSSVIYVITDDGHLDAKGWPLGGRITHASAIHRVEESHDLRASHAASIDRLRIDHGHGGLIFIAVRDKAAFLDALAEQDAGLIRTPTGIRRTGPGD